MRGQRPEERVLLAGLASQGLKGGQSAHLQHAAARVVAVHRGGTQQVGPDTNAGPLLGPCHLRPVGLVAATSVLLVASLRASGRRPTATRALNRY